MRLLFIIKMFIIKKTLSYLTFKDIAHVLRFILYLQISISIIFSVKMRACLSTLLCCVLSVAMATPYAGGMGLMGGLGGYGIGHGGFGGYGIGHGGFGGYGIGLGGLAGYGMGYGGIGGHGLGYGGLGGFGIGYGGLGGYGMSLGGLGGYGGLGGFGKGFGGITLNVVS